MVIPLTHHKNSGYTERKVLGVYFSAFGGEIISNTDIFYLNSFIPIWLCIVPLPKAGGTIRKNSHFVSSAIHIKIGIYLNSFEIIFYGVSV